jgi:hypothetical protein
MACCGQKRQQMISQAIPVRQTNEPVKPVGFAQVPIQERGVPFQYVGKTALTAVSPTSGRQYRFGHPGAIVEVDPRDRASLANIPSLREI